MKSQIRRPLAAALVLLAASPFFACAGARKPDNEPAPAAAPPAPAPAPEAPGVAPPAPNRQIGPSGPQVKPPAAITGSHLKAKKGYVPMCEGPGGVIKDDGQLETGYSYVPNATSGIYLQEYSADDFWSRELDHVCVCWLHKRDDTEIDFEVVFYEKKEGKPAENPYATRPGKAVEVPLNRESGGLFYDVDVSGVTLVPGTSYIGVRWNPSVDPYFFVCADHGPNSPVTAGFQRDDRAPGWLAILGSPDPIFTKHKAMMLRVVPKPGEGPAPERKAIDRTAKPEPKKPIGPPGG
jgi:hypothetical protein